MDIGKSIKEKRNAIGMTMKKLGEEVGVSEQAISQYENNKREPNMEIILKISNALNCTVKDLVGNDIYEIYKSLMDKAMDATERAFYVAEKLEKYGDSWKDAVTNIENSPEHLLSSILMYMENTEEYYSSVFVNTQNIKNDSMPYLTKLQVDDIVKKITELVKYEIYKIENKI